MHFGNHPSRPALDIEGISSCPLPDLGIVYGKKAYRERERMDGSQYDLSITTTLSIPIVTAAVGGDKSADGIGSGNWASQVMGPVGRTLCYFP